MSRPRTLEAVMAGLIESGIQVAIITALPKSIDCHIGDETKGPVAQRSFKPQEFGEVRGWLLEQGLKHYLRSQFAKIEWTDA